MRVERLFWWVLGGVAILAGFLAGLLALRQAPYVVEVRHQTGQSGFGHLFFDWGNGFDRADSHRFPVHYGSSLTRYRLPLPAGGVLTGIRLVPNRSNTETRLQTLQVHQRGGALLAEIPVEELNVEPADAVRRMEGDVLFVSNTGEKSGYAVEGSWPEPVPLPMPAVWWWRAFLVGGMTLIGVLAAALGGRRMLRCRAGAGSKRLGIPVAPAGKTGWLWAAALVGALVVGGAVLHQHFRGVARAGLELELRSGVNDRAQVFYDTGRGWREQYSFFFPVSQGEEWSRVRVPLPPGKLRGLRIDPLGGEGRVAIRRAELVRGEAVVASLDLGGWQKNSEVASWEATGDHWQMETTPGATDPHFMIPLAGSITLRETWADFFLKGMAAMVAGGLAGAAGAWLVLIFWRWSEAYFSRRIRVGMIALAVLAGAWVGGFWVMQNSRLHLEAWVLPPVTSSAQLRFDRGNGWEANLRARQALTKRAGWQKVRLAARSDASPFVIFRPSTSYVGSGPIEMQLGPVQRGWWSPWSERVEIAWMRPHHGVESLQRSQGGDRPWADRPLYRITPGERGPADLLVALPPVPRADHWAGPVMRPGKGDWRWQRNLAGLLVAAGTATVFLWVAAGVLLTGRAWETRWGRAEQVAAPTGRARAAERVFCWNGLLFGVLFAFLIPVNQSPDEARNFRRAWDVSEGNPMPRLTADGEQVVASLPASLGRLDWIYSGVYLNPDVGVQWGQVVESAKIRVEPEQRQEFDLTDTVYLSFLPYLGSAAGIVAGRALDLPLIGVFYAGRVGNLLLGLLLGLLVLRSARHWHWTLAVIMLTPMSLYLMASNSHDSVTLALGLLVFTSILRLRTAGEAELSWWHAWPLMLLFPALVFSKLNYILLSPLVLLVPASRFRSLHQAAGAFVATAGISLVAVGLWAAYYADKPSSEWDRGHVDRELQKNLVVDYPAYYAQVVVDSLRFQGVAWARQMVGVFGWLDTYVPAGVILLWLLGVFWAMRLDVSTWPNPLRWWERVGTLLVLGWAFLGIITIFFITWTEEYSLLIQGAQGRYFLMLVPWLVVALAAGRDGQSRGVPLARFGVSLVVPLFLAWAAWLILIRFWAS